MKQNDALVQALLDCARTCDMCTEACKKCAEECRNYHTANVSDREMM